VAADANGARAFGGAVIVMGIGSCGKSTVGAMLAQLLAARFVEGDQLHPPANIAKMSGGVPLVDEDRWPWLDAVGAAMSAPGGVVAACSALRRVYRERLALAARRPLHFVFLDGPHSLFAQRMAARPGHFMPASLLESQLATLERPGADENALVCAIQDPPDVIARQAAEWLR
jgi:gluconokinase